MYGYVSSQQGYQSTSICLESIYIPISIYIYIYQSLSRYINLIQFTLVDTNLKENHEGMQYSKKLLNICPPGLRYPIFGKGK